MAAEINYYEVLEVPNDAPQTEIHKAYQRAKSTYSQDNPALYSMFTREEARDLLKMVEEAYAVLGNHALRKNYDDRLMTLPKAATVRPPGSMMPPMSSPVLDHNALPDFIVPDPAIPGSGGPITASHLIKPAPTPTPMAQSVVANTPPASRPADPLQSVFGGPRESILISSDDFTVRKRDGGQGLPPGMAKVMLATYKVDEGIEKEIAEKVDFDGPFLQRVRVYKQVPMDKLSESSRIGKTYLIALESNDYKNLPAPVFLRGFLVQLAKQLGLDEGKVATSYMKLAKASGKYGS